jgi:hypothetical protein
MSESELVEWFDCDEPDYQPIAGIDRCPHGVLYDTDCDDCYDKASDSFSIVRAIEKI